MKLKEQLVSKAKENLADIKKIRQTIHEYPELAYNENNTAKLIADYLEKENIYYERKNKFAKTGVLGIIKGRKTNNVGPVVALRCDMDALKKHEISQCPYASKIPGCMHACGHDGHVAILLGAAKLISLLKNKFSGHVKFIFQPGEENGSGALAMIKEGVLEYPKVEWMFALHSWPYLPCGTIGIKENSITSAASQFIIEITGKSTHAAHPHKGVDPIVIAADIINSIQKICSRISSPIEPGVISITMIETGNKGCNTNGPPGSYPLLKGQWNVIPDIVRLTGTTRAFTNEQQKLQLSQIKNMSQQIALMFGAKSEFYVKNTCPSTVNNMEATQMVKDVGIELLGKDNVIPLKETSMGGEDFSYYLQNTNIKGSYFRLGLANKSCTSCPCLHSNCFDFNDDALIPGMLVMAGTALKILRVKI